MPILRTITEKVPVRIWTEDIDEETLAQLRAMAKLDVVYPHIAVMPDVHLGIGATVGAVIPTRGAIIPAAVGVDIGCGMCWVRTSLRAEQLPDSLRALRGAIEDAIPVGFASHRDPLPDRRIAPLLRRLEPILERAPAVAKRLKDAEGTAARQAGTLGGGNHFIELVLDEEDHVGVMLHSGSRGIGNAIGTHYIEVARREMERLDRQLPHRDLAYLREGTVSFDDYVEAVSWAQDYARLNRALMLERILAVMRRHLPPFELTAEAVNCHHNYVAVEEHFGERLYVTRKGAIRAGEGELGIIPGSMGARSYIVRGKGNRMSLCSCSHGAGRRYSRAEAKRRFSVADLARQTEGVECRKDPGVLDEIPAAYKDIDTVMAQQQDLVEVVHALRQVLCVKG
ncbi:MAG: RtcB family protein [Xanthomonadales bacterium]|nr:RtcB family protein [Xanthomonadales bacterium]